jgi:hypothetical protein
MFSELILLYFITTNSVVQQATVAALNVIQENAVAFYNSTLMNATFMDAFLYNASQFLNSTFNNTELLPALLNRTCVYMNNQTLYPIPPFCNTTCAA